MVVCGFAWWLSGKESACQYKMWVQSLSREDPLEEEIAIQVSVFAWENPWAEEPGGWSMGSQKNQTRLSD